MIILCSSKQAVRRKGRNKLKIECHQLVLFHHRQPFHVLHSYISTCMCVNTYIVHIVHIAIVRMHPLWYRFCILYICPLLYTEVEVIRLQQVKSQNKQTKYNLFILWSNSENVDVFGKVLKLIELHTYLCTLHSSFATRVWKPIPCIPITFQYHSTQILQIIC